MRVTPTKLASLASLLVFAVVLVVLSNTGETDRTQRNVDEQGHPCHSSRFGCNRKFRSDPAPVDTELDPDHEKKYVSGVIRGKQADVFSDNVEDSVDYKNGPKSGEDILESWEYNETEKDLAWRLQNGVQKSYRGPLKLSKDMEAFQLRAALKKKQTVDEKVGGPKLVEPNVDYYDVETDPGKPQSCAVILSDEGLVRSCVSKKRIGSVSAKKMLSFKNFKDPKSNGTKDTSETRQESFQKVFDTLAWGHDWDPNQKGLNVSGMGATVPWAQEAMATLHLVIDEIKQKYGKKRVKMLDVPCGDMGWMSRFLKTRDDIDYMGMDIVPDLIENHQKIYNNQPWKFLHADILTEKLPSGYDLIFSRTLLQHLYFSEVEELLYKISSSGSLYLLTTTWAGHQLNKELEINEDNPGRFRELNLEISPISLSPPLCLQRDGPPDAYQGWDHFLALWPLPLTRSSACGDKAEGRTLPGTEKTIYSCVPWADT